MIRSKDMVKVTLFANQKEREPILETLHTIGSLQLIDLKSQNIALDNAFPGDDLKQTADFLLRISRMISIYNLAPKILTWQQKLYGYETMKRSKKQRQTKHEIFSDASNFLQSNEKRILKLEEEYTKAIDTTTQLKQHQQTIDLLFKYNIPAGILSNGKSYQFIAGETPLPQLFSLEKELKSEIKSLHVESHKNQKSAITIITTLIQDKSKAELIAKKNGMSIFALPKLPKTDNVREYIKEQITIQEQAHKTALEQIKKEQSHLDDAIFLREELELQKERTEAIHKLKESQSFFALQGWATKDDLKKIQTATKQAHIVVESPKSDEETPIVLSNPAPLRPFEVLTELYSLPRYKNLDPTFIVAPLFLIYAGFMLTDFVYGLGLVLLGSILYLLFRKQAGGTKDISVSIFFIGIVSMFFGVLTGSYLGDAPQYFFGTAFETAKIALWADPLAEPLYFLIISLIVGLAHLNIGLFLGATEDIRKREWKIFFSERFTWWFLQLAILATYFLNKSGQSTLIMLAPIIAVVLYIIAFHGPLGILGATGFLGDVISYSRLFALALSTAGIAMTVNLLADMLRPVPYIGLIAAALIFICGHLFSFLMNALGSFVHSIRLQFVEFFGKFYEGGGERFIPFKEERVYTEDDK